MGHDAELLAAAGVGGGAGGRIAKSVVLDQFTNHGHASLTLLRSIDFWFQGSKITVSAVSGIADATTELNSNFIAEFMFYTALSKVGTVTDTSWAAGTGVSRVENRIFFTFNNPITFDTIVINNCHDSGLATDAGINEVKIYTTEDTGPIVKVYEAPITDGVLIYDGVFREHVAANIEDPETLVLIP